MPGNTTVSRKTYFLAYVLTTTWVDAWSFCKSSTMELVTFEAQAEVDAFLKLVEAAAAKFTLCKGLHVGAVASATPATTSSWTWLSTGNPLGVTLAWAGAPVGTNNCLEIVIDAKGKAAFTNIDCYLTACTFVCTDTKIVAPKAAVTSTSPDYFTQAKKANMTLRP